MCKILIAAQLVLLKSRTVVMKAGLKAIAHMSFDVGVTVRTEGCSRTVIRRRPVLNVRRTASVAARSLMRVSCAFEGTQVNIHKRM